MRLRAVESMRLRAVESPGFWHLIDDNNVVLADFPQYAITEQVVRRLEACWNACLGIPTETLEAGVVVVPVSKLDGALHDLAFEVMTRCVKGRTTILVDLVDQAIAKCKAHLQQNGGEGR